MPLIQSVCCRCYTTAYITAAVTSPFQVPLIEGSLLRHKTFAEKEISIMLKLAFFQVTVR